jgi:hypothetical protein
VKTSKWILTAALASLLCACGGKGPPGAAGGSGDSADSRPRNANASAEEVAEEMRGDVDCPAHIASAARGADQPVIDVLGVRPGLTYDEAANVVLCSNELMVVANDGRGFQLQTFGEKLRQGFSAAFAEPRVEKTSQQIMQEMQESALSRSGNRVVDENMEGKSKWYVGTIGMPGEERVINAAREEWFVKGRNPTMDSVEQALLKKYGKPTRMPPPASSQRYITWAYDPLGRPISETSPLYSRCTGVADPDGGANFSPDCGVVITAAIFALPDNAELVRFFQVGVVDQAGGYEALTATEQGLQAKDTKRKAEAVKEASKNSDAPQL